MKAFQALFDQLDRVTGTRAKVSALVEYFGAVPPEDAAWALALLLGKRRKRLITGRRLREILRDRGGRHGDAQRAPNGNARCCKPRPSWAQILLDRDERHGDAQYLRNSS